MRYYRGILNLRFLSDSEAWQEFGLFLLAIICLGIFIWVCCLIYKGFKKHLNAKVAGILTAVVLISGIVLMYNNDYIKEAACIIKEAAGRPRRLPKANVASELREGTPLKTVRARLGRNLSKLGQSIESTILALGRKNGESTVTVENYGDLLLELNNQRKWINENKNKIKNADEQAYLNALIDERRTQILREVEPIFQKQREVQRKAEEAEIHESVERDLKFIDALDRAIENNTPLTQEQIAFIKEHPNAFSEGIDRHNRMFPDNQLNYDGTRKNVESTGKDTHRDEFERDMLGNAQEQNADMLRMLEIDRKIKNNEIPDSSDLEFFNRTKDMPYWDASTKKLMESLGGGNLPPPEAAPGALQTDTKPGFFRQQVFGGLQDFGRYVTSHIPGMRKKPYYQITSDEAEINAMIRGLTSDVTSDTVQRIRESIVAVTNPRLKTILSDNLEKKLAAVGYKEPQSIDSIVPKDSPEDRLLNFFSGVWKKRKGQQKVEVDTQDTNAPKGEPEVKPGGKAGEEVRVDDTNVSPDPTTTETTVNPAPAATTGTPLEFSPPSGPLSTRVMDSFSETIPKVVGGVGKAMRDFGVSGHNAAISAVISLQKRIRLITAKRDFSNAYKKYNATVEGTQEYDAAKARLIDAAERLRQEVPEPTVLPDMSKRTFTQKGNDVTVELPIEDALSLRRIEVVRLSCTANGLI